MTDPPSVSRAERSGIEMVPECHGQAVCTNGRRCMEAGECLRPYQCRTCLRSTANSDRVCAACKAKAI